MQPVATDLTPRALALVQELNRRWQGREVETETATVIDAFELLSPPQQWPPSIRIDFTTKGRRGVWDNTWDTVLLNHGCVADATEWLIDLVRVAFAEMYHTSPHPGVRFVDATAT